MSFQNIMGQDIAKKMLQSALRNEAVNHAYVFSGPPGSGQIKMAQTFAKALFCERMTDDACGECLSCRKVEHGNHPDLFIVEPDGATIKIDQIRGLQRIFSYKSESANPKVYIIQQADTMTVQAANSLLKFLEEPQVPVVGILISENGQALLPTIQSRTQQVPFHALQPEVMMQALIGEGYTAGLVRSAVHIASGLESCREILQQNWFAEIRNVVLQLVKESMSRGSSSIILAQQKIFKTGLSEHLDILFHLFHLWFKDMLHFRYGRHESIVFIDHLESVSKLAITRSTEQWVSYMDLAANCRKKLRFHVNGQLCVEQLLIGLSDTSGSITG
ncbi:DNA polymerase III subunit delta' [Paenibacillus sp. 28ISP30-2]|uniref:DNA polymerase III subunit delta' n=1 Tax=Paenibacillus sp. 23TSA30-6 TaxID=2546104 RepID=UPI0017885F71|nr:DNA polymerase III subunit delta' [Paenibacillus sp. 23TSA30-6]MBE0338445.1 DNA polymerase III subunit delta' [Paenibacillus sp. 23TSA30-6]MBE0340082.1 DNA polymerase III subunit delta' [Paenibacillus sp. 28ISP30-2]